MSCTMLSLSKLCVRLGELCGKAPQKQDNAPSSRELCSRRSFQRPKPDREAGGSLLDLAAEVAWRNIDLYSSSDLDALPVDLAQQLLDKLVYAGKLTQPMLTKLASQQLSSLQLGGSLDVTDAWLAQTTGFALHRLSLANCGQVGDEGLQHLHHQRALRDLDLTSCTSISDAGLQHLSGLRRLQSLSMPGCEALTGAGLAYLATLTALTSLNLEQWRDVTTLQPLRGMTRIRHLNLGWCCHIGDEAVVRCLQHMRQMVDLRLSRCQISDAGLAILENLGQLERLDLAGCVALTNACMPRIAALKHLTRLSLEHCRLTDAGLRQLAKTTSLQHLNVAYTSVSDYALLTWSTLVNLRTLTLDSCAAVHDEAMVLLKSLPLLQDLDLSDTLVTNSGLVHLEPLKHISCISLSYTGGAHSISDLGTARLSRLVSLQVLNLDMRSIGDAGVRNLSGLTNLRYLDLFGAKVSDAGCGCLKRLTALEVLEICGGAVTDRGVSHMASLLALRHLSLAQNARITDASLLVLSALTSLTFLNLSQSKLTGNGIQHLQNLQKLEALVIVNTRVRRPAAERLQAVLPNLQLLDC